ncbi:MAG TPA: TIR domain-containing protein [Steroidobacteraceae bacterium]|nr:TIR domain-containing protein [Steroidobacteraceae bacterium]
MTSPDIFLSYNREDHATARRFAECFEAQGLKVWWDVTLRSGEAYDEVTENALRAARAVVVLWSKKSVVSRWVRAEATLADRNRTLVPAMIEPCERPIMFELTQTADLSRWSGDAGDKAWVSFLADVQQFVRADGAGSNTQLLPQIATPAATTSQPSKDHRPSLAILPFTNRSGERADDVFADGMVEDLISALSLSSAIKVIAQSATAVYRKNVSDLRTIGQELGVRYLLEGNVRRVGATLRVTAQLVEAANGAILWSQKFDRPLTELADLQEDLVMEVAGHLGVQVERNEMEEALRKPGDLTAWEAVMRCLAAYAKHGHENQRISIAEGRKAVAIAPDYALGHAALAQALAARFMLGGGKDEAIAREARAHSERALALDAQDPLVLTYVAFVLGHCGSWSEAFMYAQRSVDLNPNIAPSRRALAQLCIRFNRPDEAIAHLDAEAILAPRGYMTFLSVGYRGLAHFQAGRYEQALQAVEQSLLLSSGHVYGLKDKAVVCKKLGRLDAARDAIRRLRAVDPSATLEDIEAANTASFMAPEMAADMNATLRELWLDTPREPQAK